MQNSDLKKELLGQHKEVSAKELENYLSGKLSPSEARAIELKLNSSAFSSDAYEGHKTYASAPGISGNNQPWHTASNKGVIWISATLLLIAVSGLLTFQHLNNSPEITAETPSLPQPTAQEEKTEVSVEKVTPEINDTPTIIVDTTPVKEDTPQALKTNDNNDSESLPILFSAEIEEEVFRIKPLENKSGKLHLKTDVNALKTQSARLRHYKNFKLVDQGIGIDESLLQPILEGTPAFMERIVINPKYPDWVPADSIYKCSMNEAIDWLIEKDYKQAKMRLTRLTENTPEDLTATFYLGYTLYLKGEYANAITYFNRSQKHIIQTYDQDSRFLEIKCLIELGKWEEARKEATYLKDSGSYYAEKALELVD